MSCLHERRLSFRFALRSLGGISHTGGTPTWCLGGLLAYREVEMQKFYTPRDGKLGLTNNFLALLASLKAVSFAVTSSPDEGDVGRSVGKVVISFVASGARVFESKHRRARARTGRVSGSVRT